MKKCLPFLDHDLQNSGPQYLEDLATGYWFSEILFTSVEMDIFSRLEPKGASLNDLSGSLLVDPMALSRLLDALSSISLITKDGDRYCNTGISHEYLVTGKKDYQGGSILWRRYLQSSWAGLADCLKAGGRVDYGQQDKPSARNRRIKHYMRAMDSIAKTKTGEILGYFEGVALKGRLLDVGAGSGAFAASFIKQYPGMRATLLDLPDILKHTKEAMEEQGFGRQIQYLAGNILEQWPIKKKSFDLVVLSNIIHAYSEAELPHILKMATDTLKNNGLLLIHDFFSEHYPEKAALTDLNMFINTYNGRVFSSSFINGQLAQLGLSHTIFAPLKTDTAVLFTSANAETIRTLKIDSFDQLLVRIKAIGFKKICRLKAEEIQLADWTGIKCRFGCDRYNSLNCRPNSMPKEKTGAIIREYRHALLLEGEPPTRDFQKRVLEAEREAFLSGYHKTFSFWAGPCSICVTCASDGNCRNTAHTRPSMEGAGIDVFETARRAGAKVRTLRSRTDYIKYFGLILLD
ncbi:MAG: methyltransferase domain-containing protein [Nitrospirae bacterium]|nr:methyltransferase domain-containing protein [Nitrospirota bacterium]